MENEMEMWAAVEAGVAKAEKYWTATDAEWAVFSGLLDELELDLDAVERQKWAPHWDGAGTRLYHEMEGPSVKNPKVRELAARLQKAGVKAHATARMIGVPPKTVGPMIAAVNAPAKKAEVAA